MLPCFFAALLKAKIRSSKKSNVGLIILFVIKIIIGNYFLILDAGNKHLQSNSSLKYNLQATDCTPCMHPLNLYHSSKYQLPKVTTERAKKRIPIFCIILTQ